MTNSTPKAQEPTVVECPAFWDDIADEYAAKPVANVPAYQRKLAITRERLRAQHRVLDIGCGTGSLALELAPHVRQVDSIDISAAMVDIARGKIERAGARNIELHHANLDAGLEFGPASFDVVCAFNILHLVDEQAQTLSEIRRVLKPDGVMISSTACLGGLLSPYRPIIGVMRLLGKAPPVRVFKITTHLEAIRTAGFVDVQSHDVGGSKTNVFATANVAPAT